MPFHGKVSILVLMEFPFTPIKGEMKYTEEERFNPCFNGISFHTMEKHHGMVKILCFNPCFNGISFHTEKDNWNEEKYESFNPCFNGISFHTN